MQRVRKEWQSTLVGAFITIIIGLSMLVVAANINIPSAYKTFLGIPYAVNPEFVFLFYEMIILFMMGFLSIGMGIGLLSSAYLIYRLEKKIPQTPPPPP